MTAQALREGIRRVELVATAITAGIDAEFASKLADESADELIVMICAVSEAAGIAEVDDAGQLVARPSADLQARLIIERRNEVLSRAMGRETAGAL
jgi:hypothetical protein